VAPTVLSVSPADGSTLVCRTKAVTSTFDEPMDPLTITQPGAFTVTEGGVAVPGSVTYDAATQQARFLPTDPTGFRAGGAFVATIRSGVAGVTDLAGNPLAADKVWNFTTGADVCLAGPNLRSIAPFAAFGGTAGMTNQGVLTRINGDLGTTAVCTGVTGFHDAVDVYTETTLNVGIVNGVVDCAPPAPGTAAKMAIATQALIDARLAFAELALKPNGSLQGAGQLGGLTLTPGVYKASAGTYAITSGDLTLDAQGDSNAVWVFQSATSLTVGLSATPRQVLLINGADARNVYWQVGSAARIENGSSMVGTIFASAGVTVSTAGQVALTNLLGRAIGLDASVTMVNTVITIPPGP
jgi:hypothetical protein